MSKAMILKNVYASLLLITLNYYDLTNAITITKKSSGILRECPGQNVESIKEEVKRHEIALVFYYVSWSTDSIRIKSIYDELATFYVDHAMFATVDCWRLECNCSQTLSLANGGNKKGYPHKWPTLLVHFRTSRISNLNDFSKQSTILYNDDWSFGALSRFLNNLYRPLQRIHSKSELKTLALHSDVLVLGLFQSANDKEYRIFVTAAIKWLENDPERSFRFCVALGSVSKNLAKTVGMSELPLLLFITEKDIQRFNQTKSGNWKSTHIVLWLQAEVKRVSKDISGYNNPSTTAQQLKYGAVLAIFINELEHKQNFFDYMKGVLGGSMGAKSLEHSSIDCLRYWQAKAVQNDIKEKIVASHFRQELKEMQEMMNDTQHGRCSAMAALNCKYTAHYRLQEEIGQNYLATNHQHQLGSQIDEDRFGSTKLLDLYRYRSCLNYFDKNTPEFKLTITKLLRKYIEAVVATSQPNSNRTLAVSIMSSAKHSDFFDLHDIRNWRQRSATVLILDSKQEGIYHMQEAFSYQNVLKFIHNFYSDHLTLMFKSAHIPNMPSLKEFLNQQQQPQLHISSSMTNNELFKIQDVNRQLFLQLMQKYDMPGNTTTVCLLYSPDCVFSTLLSHAMLQVSAVLQFSDIKIIRINLKSNDLPWHFVMNATPTLILFPHGNSGDSHIFPSNIKIDFKNIFGFILTHLQPVEQVRVALMSCRRPGLPTEHLIKCLNFAKTLAMQQISHHLKLWQVFEEERKFVLERLKQFKDITLDMQQTFRS